MQIFLTSKVYFVDGRDLRDFPSYYDQYLYLLLDKQTGKYDNHSVCLPQRAVVPLKTHRWKGDGPTGPNFA